MRHLIIRLAAFGDVLVTVPLIRYLHNRGDEVYVLTTNKGEDILKYNPYVDKIIMHDEDVPNRILGNYFKRIQKENKCDNLIDLCESVETKIIFKSYQPQYNYPKAERRELAEHNMYELTFTLAGIDPSLNDDWNPQMFFSQQEEEMSAGLRSRFLGRKIIVWGLSGSGLHKAYPYVKYVLSKLFHKHDDLLVMTVGDVPCQILEIELDHVRILHYSGNWTFRESSIMVKHAHGVISTETGITHVGGCFDTPQVIMYSHTTHECLGKHFRNAIPIHPNVPCAPCFRLIDNSPVQCPTDKISTAPVCMASGIDPDMVIESLENILEQRYALVS